MTCGRRASAVALGIAAVVVAGGCGDSAPTSGVGSLEAGDSPTVAERPVAPPAASSVAPPASSSVVSSVAASQSSQSSLTWSGWVRDRIDEGFVFVGIGDGVGTSARWLQADDAEGGTAGAAAVLLEDGTVVPLPNPDLRCWSRSCVFALGRRLAAVASSDAAAPALWILDPATSAWSAGADLGLDMIPLSGVSVELHDDTLLVAQRGLAEESPEHGKLVGADGSVRDMTEPPDGVPLAFDVLVGSHWLLMGFEYADDEARFARPWAYSADDDSWREVPNPPWLDCAATDTCDWAPVGDPDEMVFAHTVDRLVIEVAEGDLAMLEPATMTWVDIVEPSSGLRSHHVFAVDDQALVSMPTVFDPAAPPPGSFEVFDVTTGVWTARDLPSGVPTGPSWTTVTTPESVLLAPRANFFVTAVAPQLALDRRTLEPRPLSETDTAGWLAGVTGPTVDANQLIAALAGLEAG